MNREPSVDFIHPPDVEADELRDEGRAEGRRQGFRMLALFLASARDERSLAIAAAAVRHVLDPERETVSDIAKRLGCSRKAVHGWLRRMRRTPFNW